MIEVRELCLVINRKILVISDIHIGYEEALNRQGFLIPRMQFRDIVQRLERIIGKNKFKIIIVNGDLKHEFRRISEQEWRQTSLLLDFMSKHSEKIVLIKGNHDNILGPIASKKKLDIVDYFVTGDILILHGNKEIKAEKLKKIKNSTLKERACLGCYDDLRHGGVFEQKKNERGQTATLRKQYSFSRIKTIIIGHEHPAISIQEGMRAEKFKCFLFGKYKGKNLIVMPSFNPIIEGTDVRKEKLLSPYIKNIDEFRAVVITDEGTALDFGKIKGLKNV
jgi:hypothetical protein